MSEQPAEQQTEQTEPEVEQTEPQVIEAPPVEMSVAAGTGEEKENQ